LHQHEAGARLVDVDQVGAQGALERLTVDVDHGQSLVAASELHDAGGMVEAREVEEAHAVVGDRCILAGADLFQPRQERQLAIVADPLQRAARDVRDVDRQPDRVGLLRRRLERLAAQPRLAGLPPLSSRRSSRPASGLICASPITVAAAALSLSRPPDARRSASVARNRFGTASMSAPPAIGSISAREV
jgi:hypothetical protein